MYNINMEYVKQATDFIEKQIQYPMSNPYIMAFVKVTLALYAAQIAPRPPQYLSNFFQNTFVKIALITIIVYLSNKDLQLALLLSIIYVYGMNLLAGRGMFESFADYSSEYKGSDAQFLEPKTMLYPGCSEVTMDHLYKVFEGDKKKFETTVQYAFQDLMSRSKTKDAKELVEKLAYAAGLPYNLSFDKPETAPYIATLLVNYGFTIDELCQPPH
jgi:hypothetical protein